MSNKTQTYMTFTSNWDCANRMIRPNPSSGSMNSATTAPKTARVNPIFVEATIDGRAIGRRTNKIPFQNDAWVIFRYAMYDLGVWWNALVMEIYMGKNAINAAIASLEWKPTPRAIIINGAIACNGNDCDKTAKGEIRRPIIGMRSPIMVITKEVIRESTEAAKLTQKVDHQLVK